MLNRRRSPGETASSLGSSSLEARGPVEGDASSRLAGEVLSSSLEKAEALGSRSSRPRHSRLVQARHSWRQAATS